MNQLRSGSLKDAVTNAIVKILNSAQEESIRTGRADLAPADDTVKLNVKGLVVSDDYTVDMSKMQVDADYRPGLIVQALRDTSSHDLVYEILTCVHVGDERVQYLGIDANRWVLFVHHRLTQDIHETRLMYIDHKPNPILVSPGPNTTVSQASVTRAIAEELAEKGLMVFSMLMFMFDDPHGRMIKRIMNKNKPEQ